jgi:polyvinyl alcohol dehydrogenase (cytochrome)
MNRSVRLRARASSPAACLLVLTVGLAFSGTTLGQSWSSAGADLNNSHSQGAETQISPKTAPNLRLKWNFATAGDVTAIPAVVGGYVYFPDNAGYIYKVNATTGQLAWSTQVAAITGVAGDFARTTPAITGNTLIIGTQTGRFFAPQNGVFNTQPQLIALDTGTGTVLWQTKVDQTPQAFVTNSAVIAPGGTKGVAIIGVASNEELTAAFVPPSFWQWQFRGSAVAIDVATGLILWQTYTAPPGYYGNSIWGSTAAVDLARNQVYLATGDTFMAPASVLSCLALGGGQTCVDPTNYSDSIVAFDLSTGKVKWAGRGWPYDVWSVACGLGTPGFSLPNPYIPTPGIPGNCSDPSNANGTEYQLNPLLVGPDYDFAQGPMLFSDTGSTTDLPLVGAGEKSGAFWTFRTKDGAKVWSTQVSPGGVTGGMQWGSATDGSTIYVSASNAGPSLNGGGAGAAPWRLANGQIVHSGGWAALDAATGKIKWTTPDPYGSRAEGPVTLANGVVFGCNMQGTMFAFNAKNGSQLWQYPLTTPNGCIAGAAVVNGMVFWGSGDGRSNPGAAKSLFAFGL